VATSDVPIRENTLSTSGMRISSFSMGSCIATLWLTEVPGMRIACNATSPSSRFGMNSVPIFEVIIPEATSTARAVPATITGRRMAHSSPGT